MHNKHPPLLISMIQSKRNVLWLLMILRVDWAILLALPVSTHIAANHGIPRGGEMDSTSAGFSGKEATAVCNPLREIKCPFHCTQPCSTRSRDKHQQWAKGLHHLPHDCLKLGFSKWKGKRESKPTDQPANAFYALKSCLFGVRITVRQANSTDICICRIIICKAPGPLHDPY